MKRKNDNITPEEPPQKRVKYEYIKSSKVTYNPSLDIIKIPSDEEDVNDYENESDSDVGEIIFIINKIPKKGKINPKRKKKREIIIDDKSSSEDQQYYKTFLEAAIYIFKTMRRYMTVRELWKEINKRKLVYTLGKTPVNTLNAILHRNIKKQDSLLRKSKSGSFALKKWK